MLWLHRYSRLLAAASLVLITAGGLVTSTGSGLAVPDWPSTYGYFMFTFPLSKMVGGILYEHGHRLIASVVGMLTIGLAVWLSAVDPRRWMRRLGWTALGAVIVQGLLGGITVLLFLPPAVSISHAGLAQLFFALVTGLAICTSRGWLARYGRDAASERALAADHILRRLVVAAPIAVYARFSWARRCVTRARGWPSRTFRWLSAGSFRPCGTPPSQSTSRTASAPCS